MVIGKSGKPSIAITKDFDVYLYNTTKSPLNLQAMELFGFGTGSFVDSAISNFTEDDKILNQCPL